MVGYSVSKETHGTCGSRLWHGVSEVAHIFSEEFLLVFGMLRIHVTFPSGSGETLSLPEHSKVGDLKLLTQETFRKGFVKLVTVEGHVLTNLANSLQTAGVQDGEHLTAVVQEVKVAATDSAFAMWCCEGNQVVTWGHPQ